MGGNGTNPQPCTLIVTIIITTTILMMMIMMMITIMIIIKISPLLALDCWVCRGREYETTGQMSPIKTDLV